MIIVYLTYILIFIQAGVKSTIIKPDTKCVPTTKMKSDCHICICNANGTYGCFKKPRCIIKAISRQSKEMECIPYNLYTDNFVFCSCGSDGKWHTLICRKYFGTFIIDATTEKLIVTRYRSAVSCDPGTHYLVDCNLCQCNDDGYFDTNSCTHRTCAMGHKADKCKFGDFLRTAGEICICSDIDYYIDALCVPVEKTKTQQIDYKRLIAITDIADETIYRRLKDDTNHCVPLAKYSINDAKCTCFLNGTLSCGKTINQILRKEDKPKDLPELLSENDKCEPFEHYKIKCNQCVCSKDGVPKCTQDECSEDLPLKLLSMPYTYTTESSSGVHLVVA